jgi:RNA polymerase sigma-70 factor (ECF subfamily)
VERTSLEELAVTAAGGDLAAVERLVVAFHDHLFAFLYLLGVRDADVDDVAQEVTLEIYRSLGRYECDQPFLPWMRAIARNVTSKHWRSKRRRREHMTRFRELVEERLDAGPVAEAAEGFAVGALRSCVERLQQRQKRVIDLRYQDGMDSSSIAKALGMTSSGVRTVLARVRDALKACVESARGARAT